MIVVNWIYFETQSCIIFKFSDVHIFAWYSKV